MLKYAMVAALLGLAACGSKAEQAPAADSTVTAATVAPAADTAAVAPADSMARDTTKTQ